MKVAFFSQDDQIQELLLQTDYQACLFTSSLEELDDFIAEEETVLLFIDYDDDLKIAEKLNEDLLEDEFIIRVIITESLPLKKLKQHQSSKLAAHGYIRKPLDLDVINGVLNDFEWAEHVDENDLTEEGDDLGTPDLTFIGFKNPLLEENNSDESIEVEKTEEIKVSESESGEGGLVFGEDPNEPQIPTHVDEDEVDFNSSVVMKMDSQVRNILEEHGIYMTEGASFDSVANQEIQAKFDTIFGVKERPQEQMMSIPSPLEMNEGHHEEGISLDLGGEDENLEESSGTEGFSLEFDTEDKEEGSDLPPSFDIEDDEIVENTTEEEVSMSEHDDDNGLEFSIPEEEEALDITSPEIPEEEGSESEDDGLVFDLGGNDESEDLNLSDDGEEGGLDLGGDDEGEGLEFGGADESEGLDLSVGDEDGGVDLGGADEEAGLDLGGVEEEAGLDLGGTDEEAGLDLGGSDEGEGLEFGINDEGEELDLGEASTVEDLNPSSDSEDEEISFAETIESEGPAEELSFGVDDESHEESLGAIEANDKLGFDLDQTDSDEFDESTEATRVMDTSAVQELISEEEEVVDLSAAAENEAKVEDHTASGTKNIQSTLSSIVESEDEGDEESFTEFSYTNAEAGAISPEEIEEEELSAVDEVMAEVEDETNPTVLMPRALDQDQDEDASTKTNTQEVIAAASEESLDEDATQTQAVVTSTDIRNAKADAENEGAESLEENDKIIITPESERIPSLYNEDELLRHQATIRQLREEREGLLAEINKLKAQVEILDQDNLGQKAELDEAKIEISILKKRHYGEVDELKYQLRLSDEKKEIYEERAKNYQKEFERLNQKVRIDFNQVKQREKELESQLELVRMDSESLVQSRDVKILELKRKIDALEFNMENASIREQKSKEDKAKLEERLAKIMKTLRGSIKNIEDDLELDDELIDRIEKDR